MMIEVALRPADLHRPALVRSRTDASFNTYSIQVRAFSVRNRTTTTLIHVTKMEYQVTKDSAMDTDFLDASGEVIYSTRTPLTFKTMITTLRKRAQDGVMEEIAWIRWHRLSHAELVYDGQTYDATKFLKTPP